MTELTSPPQKTNTDFLSQPLIASLNLDWEKAIYIAFIILALVTRFYGLGDRVMSHDESLHTQFSYQFFRGDGFNHTPLMHGPFLFHITPLAYWLFGDNDFSARVPVALFGVVLVLLPYFLRSWLGRIGAIFTSFIFLISPFLLYYSRYIRHDIYIITFAIILFIAIWHYLDKRREKYLYWFAVGLALMFATKEVAFIYVAIFGSFLVIRLLPQLITADWFPKIRAKFTLPLIIIILGLLLLAGGLIGQRVLIQSPEEVAATETTEPFAADPETDATIETEPPASPTETMMRWLQIAGLGVFSLGLFLAANAMRPHLDEYPEFDLIMLFATLLLPMVSPLLVVMAGWNPQEYTFNNCLLNGQETMSGFQLAIARLTTGSWWSCIAGSALMKTGAFLIGTIVIAALVGLWWNRRRWLVAAAVFYAIFLLLYTSFFTNMTGFTSGMVGSLGYWLEQQEVQRGSQPVFYYFFVVPFYEFLPLIFSLLAIRLWTMKYRLSKILGYWLLVFVLAWAGYSLGNWWFNITAVTIGEESAKFPGLLIASLILMAGLLYWFLIRAGQIKRGYELDSSLFRLFQWPLLIDFVPFVTWWLLLTWVAYSYAGEKMPWLSTHFVIPMGILSGWYFNQKLQYFDFRTLFSKNSLMYLGLTIVTVIALFLAIGPVILGVVQLGIQDIDNLSSFGRVIGSLIVVGILFYLWQLVRERIVDGRLRSALWSLSIFGILSLLTIRFAYMASFPNADYAREFLVYAHGAPAAKSIVLDQVNELSQRLHGDNSIKVGYGGSGVPWPFTWYMREYPNAIYYGETPGANLSESPIVLVGRSAWDQADNVLGNNYNYKTYTYLWWPMEDYRQIGWNAVLGDPNRLAETERRGLLNPNVRQAIWDIWFYRDFAKYDQTFGGTRTDGEWPLRDDLRLYIRKDVMTQLWDHGLVPTTAELEPVVEPFTEGQMPIVPAMTLHEPGFPGAGPGEFLAPRDVTVASDGTIFVLDSGNQRVQAFDADGELLTSWGEPGAGPGQFSPEGQGPWGIAADDEFVYVADTWNHRIEKFTHEGDFVGSFGQAGDIGSMADQGLGFFFGPRDIVILDDGRLLISDTGNHRIQMMDSDGNFLGQIGGANAQFGSTLGYFYEPVGVAVSNEGNVVVADTWNGRVQAFSPDFFPVNEWEVSSWAGNFSINNKPYAAVDSGGRVYVTDPENYRVLIFTPNGDYLGKFGQLGTEINDLGLPTGIFIDAADNIYIADAGNNRILKYDPIFAPAIPPVEPADEEGDVEEETAVEEEAAPTEEGDIEEEEPIEDETEPAPIETDKDNALTPTNEN